MIIIHKIIQKREPELADDFLKNKIACFPILSIYRGIESD
jgi:hypothetical protein